MVWRRDREEKIEETEDPKNEDGGGLEIYFVEFGREFADGDG